MQCITNSVVTGFTANVLLAAGAAPAMVDITGEAGPFAAVASAVLVNLGTPTPEQRDAAREAVGRRDRRGYTLGARPGRCRGRFRCGRRSLSNWSPDAPP